MDTSGEQTVLRRKARAAMAAQEARTMSVTRAMRLALERCAARDLGFMLTVAGVASDTVLAEQVAQDLPDDALILLLDGPDGQPGAFVLDPQMTAALVEAQTMGRVAARPALARAPTRTDAAIAEPLVAGALARVFELLDGAGDWADGFRYGAMIDSPRSLSLALGTGRYQLLRVGCGLAADREGELILALPLPTPVAPPDAKEKAGKDPVEQPLRSRLLTAPARLEAVLCRVSMPLVQAQELRPGQVVPMPADALGAATLEAAGGRVVARAVLGQMSGQRAMRLRGLPKMPVALPNEDRAGADAEQAAAGVVRDAGAGASPQGDMPDQKSHLGEGKVDPADGLPDLSEFGFDEDEMALIPHSG